MAPNGNAMPGSLDKASGHLNIPAVTDINPVVLKIPGNHIFNENMLRAQNPDALCKLPVVADCEIRIVVHNSQVANRNMVDAPHALTRAVYNGGYGAIRRHLDRAARLAGEFRARFTNNKGFRDLVFSGGEYDFPAFIERLLDDGG
jgi:hypothetical protein